MQADDIIYDDCGRARTIRLGNGNEYTLHLDTPTKGQEVRQEASTAAKAQLAKIHESLRSSNAEVIAKVLEGMEAVAELDDGGVSKEEALAAVAGKMEEAGKRVQANRVAARLAEAKEDLQAAQEGAGT